MSSSKKERGAQVAKTHETFHTARIAASVLYKGANYLLSVKDNQPTLVKAFEQADFPGE